MSIKTEFKQRLANIRAEIEEFALQLNLGKAEAKDRLDNFKEKAETELRKWQEKINLYAKENQPLIDEIRTEIDTFRVQLALGKAETREQSEEYAAVLREKFAQFTQKINNKIAENDKIKADWDTARLKLDDQVSKLRGSLEGIRLQMSLGEAEAKDEFEQIKNKVTEKVKAWEKNADEQLSDLDEKAKSVFEELETWFDKLRDDIAEKIKSKKA